MKTTTASGDQGGGHGVDPRSCTRERQAVERVDLNTLALAQRLVRAATRQSSPWTRHEPSVAHDAAHPDDLLRPTCTGRAL